MTVFFGSNRIFWQLISEWRACVCVIDQQGHCYDAALIAAAGATSAK
jgi:hypothetical protein